MFKKLIAPVIVTLVLVIYFLWWVFFFFTGPEMPFIVKVLGTIIPLSLTGVSITVLIQRIHEIRKGDEDDLSKY